MKKIIAFAFLLNPDGTHSTVRFECQRPDMGLYLNNVKARLGK